MPSTIYLSSGDEFVVLADPAEACEALTAPQPAIAFERVRWRNPKADDFDEISDLEDLPVYTTTAIVIKTASVVAVESTEPHLARIIDNARRHQLEHQ